MVTKVTQQNLNLLYKEEIKKSLIKKFQYKNIHQVPKIIKIQVNRGLGIDAQNNSILKKSIDEVRLITGQQPVITKAKNSIAGFKVREKMPLGVTVTLRNEKMYAFFEKLIGPPSYHLIYAEGYTCQSFQLKYGDREFLFC
jgi:large subunit ribosomal protein L5